MNDKINLLFCKKHSTFLKNTIETGHRGLEAPFFACKFCEIEKLCYEGRSYSICGEWEDTYKSPVQEWNKQQEEK